MYDGDPNHNTFEVFKFDIENELESEDLWQYVETPPTANDTEEIRKKRRKAYTEVARCLEGRARDTAMYLRAETNERCPHTLWEELKKQYGRVDVAKSQTDREELMTMNFERAGGSAHELTAYIKERQTRLHASGAGRIQDGVLRDRIFRIIPDHYWGCLNDLVLVEATTPDQVLERMRHWETKMNIKKNPTRNTTPDETSLGRALYTTYGRQTERSRQQPQHRRPTHNKQPCENCGLNNHAKRDCRREKVTCSFCNNRGHLARFCRKKQATEGHQRSSHGKDSRDHRARPNQPTRFAFINTPATAYATPSGPTTPTPAERVTFVCDSGATQHMSPDKTLFTNYKTHDFVR